MAVGIVAKKKKKKIKKKERKKRKKGQKRGRSERINWITTFSTNGPLQRNVGKGD